MTEKSEKPINHKTCADCIHNDVCEAVKRVHKIPKVVPQYCKRFKPKSRYIELPCAVGDTVYFFKAELEEICPAKVIKIEENYYTPSMPFWITIEYESKLIGKQKVKIAECVFKIVCYKTKEEAEQALKGNVPDTDVGKKGGV